MPRLSRCRKRLHVWDQDEIPDAMSLEASLPADARCLCGRYSWGEMNARLFETEMLERMAQ